MRAALAVAVTGTVMLVVAPAAAPAPAVERGPASASALVTTRIGERINDARRAHRARPLRISPQLSRAALRHARSMASRGFFGHTSANGESSARRIARSYPKAGSARWSVGEVIYWRRPSASAADAMRWWLSSPAHHRMLVNKRWRDVGIAAIQVARAPGVFGGRSVTIVVVDLGVR
jgi:uncharacterized protein YkwD